mmetsp:Transcript_20903/g.35799  ORF Transcript_20903/g.35799 Transcript_20903/m.35799 type:complete len:275 (+) Transcript_20903:487-1311(+)
MRRRPTLRRPTHRHRRPTLPRPRRRSTRQCPTSARWWRPTRSWTKRRTARPRRRCSGTCAGVATGTRPTKFATSIATTPSTRATLKADVAASSPSSKPPRPRARRCGTTTRTRASCSSRRRWGGLTTSSGPSRCRTAGRASAIPRSTGRACAAWPTASASPSTARTWGTTCPRTGATATASTWSVSPADPSRVARLPAERCSWCRGHLSTGARGGARASGQLRTQQDLDGACWSSDLRDHLPAGAAQYSTRVDVMWTASSLYRRLTDSWCGLGV